MVFYFILFSFGLGDGLGEYVLKHMKGTTNRIIIVSSSWKIFSILYRFGLAMFLMLVWLRIKEVRIGSPFTRTNSSFLEVAHSSFTVQISIWIRLRRFQLLEII